MGSDPAKGHRGIVCVVRENYSYSNNKERKTPRCGTERHRDTARQRGGRRMSVLVSVGLVVLLLLPIMVVDIAALISSGNPIRTRRSADRQSFLVPSQVVSSRLQTQTQTQKPKQGSSSSPSPSLSPSPSTARKALSLASMGRNPLVPSQVGGSKRAGTRLSLSINNANDTEQSNETKSKTKPKPKPKSKTTPPNEKPGTQRSSSSNSSSNGNNTKGKRNTTPQRKRVQRPTKAGDSNHRTKTRAKRQSSRHRKRPKKPRSGNLPDVLWRHIPMEHVRRHPSFVPLPEPHAIEKLEGLEDARMFRQDSWQWDVLHEGRMTTSQAVAALGFLEPAAGAVLGVPRGLRRGGMGAYHRLRRPVAVTSLEEMNERLCAGSNSGNNASEGNNNNHNNNKNNSNSNTDDDNTDDDDQRNYWTQPPGFPFAAKYMVPVTEEDLATRRRLAEKIAETRWSIRMVWGNVQEATALLTALNYFWNLDRRVVVKEIGMCGAGLSFDRTRTRTTATATAKTAKTTASESQSQSKPGLQSGLLLGATPDAVLCHPDGRIEAVEVKNHCPFVPNTAQRSKGNKTNSKNNNNHHAFRLSQQSLSWSSSSSNNNNNNNEKQSVMCQYLPQLMMEMLCLGENCRSAIMVRQTATNGSLILRIHRDDEWIEEMIYWLERFHSGFVQEGIPPPENFFYESFGGGNGDGDDSDSDNGRDDRADRERYRAFLEHTKTVERTKVELLEHVPNRSVQRAMARHPVSNDLFLD